MEPVDPKMGGLLDGGGIGGADELRSIVARAARRRLRLAGVVGAVALAAGGGVGYGISSAIGGGSTEQVVATSPQAATSGGPGAYGAPATGASSSVGSSIAVQPSQLKKLFTRHVGSIDIRGFTSMPTPLPYEGALPYQGAGACISPATGFRAEVSTPNMVSFAGGFDYGSFSAGPIVSSEPSLAGVAEGDPTAIVIVDTSSAVTLVKMDFAGGATDEMAPVQGWSVLAATWTGGKASIYGTLTALDHSGHVLSTVSVPTSGSVVPGVPGASGTAVGGSGTAVGGSGTAARGSGAVAGGAATVLPATVLPAQYPCAVPPQPSPTPNPVPPCSPSTPARGVAYACPVLPPAKTTTTTLPPATGTTTKSGSGG